MWLDVSAQAKAKRAANPSTPMFTPAILAPLLGAGGMPVEVEGVAVEAVATLV